VSIFIKPSQKAR